MKRRVILGLTGVVLVGVVIAALIVFKPFASGGGSSDSLADDGVLIECTAGESTSFEFAGETHTAELIETTDCSARIVFSSQRPSEVTLSERFPVEVDLTSDAIADVEVTLTDVTEDSATIEVVPIGFRTWDERGFTVTGGYRTYKYWNNAVVNDFCVVPQDGSYLLLYISEDRTLNWERYDMAGALITQPALQVGVIEVDSGDGKVVSVDARMSGDDLALVTVTNAGTTLRLLDPQTMQGGQPLFVGKNLSDPAVVPAGESCFVVAAGGFDPPQETAGPARIIVTEVGMADGLRILQQEAVTSPAAREDELCCSSAFDAETDTIVVVYKHRTSGENRELRVTGVSAADLTAGWTTTVAAAAARGTRADTGIVSAGGNATLAWRFDASVDGGQQLHVATVDVASGAITRVWDGPAGQSSPRLTKGYPSQMLMGDTPTLAYFDAQANPGAASGSPDRGRFALWAWEGDAWAASPTLLTGGKPLLADVLPDLNAFEQMPPKAICGAPVALKGVVVNRGSRDADGVTVTASVGGEQVASVSLGKVKAASSVEFSAIWVVPADFEQETAEVTYAITTTSEQYTTDNDSTTHEVDVRQKGLVTGRVVNASSDIQHETSWYPGLQNARVTIGDRTALTDIAGTFSLDDLEFGTYAVTVERDGFNTVSTEVTVERTRPLAFVSAEMDDHGVIEFTVVDEEGQPLGDVDVYLHDYGEHRKTPADGTLAWDMSARTYTVSFVKRGYHPVAAQEYEVRLGETTAETVTMREASTALIGGRVVDKKGAAVSNATVRITDATGTVVAQPVVSAGGTFEPVELPARPAQDYDITVTGNGITVTEAVRLYGGDDLFRTFGLVPGRGDLRARSAVEGYTSWMVHAGWPGLGPVSGADMYAWYGNYAIGVTAEYWDGTDELAAVDVTVQGGTYETHATKSEIDFSGWFEPADTGSVWDVTKWSDFGIATGLQHGDAILTVTGAIIDGLQEDDPDEWVMTGQGNELITWKEAKSDFRVIPEFDSSDPADSMWDAMSGVPTGFAIPIVIGGSSDQLTAVRVDQVDVVRLGSGESIELTGPESEWYSYQAPDGGNTNGKRYEVTQADVGYDEVVVYVWLTVQKYWGGAPGGTCFDQREQQVVIFHPGPQSMEGFIASSSLYKDPSRMAR